MLVFFISYMDWDLSKENQNKDQMVFWIFILNVIAIDTRQFINQTFGICLVHNYETILFNVKPLNGGRTIV